jgi:hypothetical protein
MRVHDMVEQERFASKVLIAGGTIRCEHLQTKCARMVSLQMVFHETLLHVSCLGATTVFREGTVRNEQACSRSSSGIGSRKHDAKDVCAVTDNSEVEVGSDNS